MKLTKSKLKQIIKEELKNMQEIKPPHKTVGDGLEDLWSDITSRVKDMDDDMSKIASEENKKLDGQVEKFLEDAKLFITSWMPNGD